MFKYYLEITKPGIILGNIILIMGSFLFTSFHSIFNFFLFLYTITGTSFIIASACVLNNLFDHDIDQKMNRTNNRALSKKLISRSSALFFSIFLGFLGVLILNFLVNLLTTILAVLGFFIYVFLYTFFYKRRTVYSTLIGSISGSIPSVIGYSAVTNTLDICSLLLFIIFILWQMSHFYSISILRIKDYKQAKIPVFSVVNGVDITKKHIFYYIVSFIFFSLLLTFLGYLSYIFLFLSSIIHFYWLFLSYLTIIDNNNNEKNAARLFVFSIVVVVFFNFLISIDFLF